MQTFDKEPQVVPFFYLDTVQNDTKSKEAGRPIFDEIEMCDIRLAGDRYFNPHVQAHEMWERRNGEEISYAMRWPDEYARFKNDELQTASGTPLEELTFLSAARRSELKALKIYTAESLASLEGHNLKVLAGEGYKLKEQAIAYLERARDMSGTTAAAAENVELRARMAIMEKQLASLQTGPTVEDADEYEGLSDADLKDKLENMTGARPKGNPARATLVRMLNDIQATSQAA